MLNRGREREYIAVAVGSFCCCKGSHCLAGQVLMLMRWKAKAKSSPFWVLQGMPAMSCTLALACCRWGVLPLLGS